PDHAAGPKTPRAVGGMTEVLEIEGLVFNLHRSPRRRTVGITVERDGELSVAAPVETDTGKVEGVVRGKLFWVFAKLAEKALLFQPAPAKDYVSGEGFYYLGRSYRLLLADEPTGALPRLGIQLVNGRFVLLRRHRAQAA